ncbi:hypothetical protein [Maridesulfovibrio sp.]|uniref:hypothetical protein n=1 Tax=unclassified Maridesulfovibrio TaxID=2794999 RepID=UPI003B004490
MHTSLDVIDSQSKSIIATIPVAGEEGFSLVLNESDSIIFKVDLPIGAEDVLLFITDIPLEPNRFSLLSDNVQSCSWTSVDKNGFFQNIYGECQLKLVYSFDSKLVECNYCPINIVGSKLSGDHVEMMIKYISSRSPRCIWSPRSATRLESSYEKSSQNCLEFFREAQLGSEVLKNVLPYIVSKPLTKLAPHRQLASAGHNLFYGLSSIDWLLSNLEVLEPDQPSPTSLSLNWRYYTPREIEIEELHEDTNIYENKMIYAYMRCVISFLLEFREKFQDDRSYEKELETYGRLPLFLILKRENIKLFSTYISRVDQLIVEYQSSISLFEDCIGVSEAIFADPMFTAKVRSNIFYRSAFERIAAWHTLGTPNWESLQSFAGIKSIDQIYENFCFFKIEEVLVSIGFNRVENIAECEIETTKYSCFENDDCFIELYHEREFRSRDYDECDEFYCIERWNTAVRHRNPNHAFSKRVPDFTLVVSSRRNASRKQLVVFDAKYTSYKLALRQYLPECVMKYVHGIADAKGGYSPVVIFYILFAGSDDAASNDRGALHYADSNYDLFSKHPQFPCLGAVEVSPRERFDFKLFVTRAINLAVEQIDCHYSDYAEHPRPTGVTPDKST